jgi:D-xylose transport system substrate-binding protein
MRALHVTVYMILGVCMFLFSCKSNSGEIGMLIASPVFQSDLAYFSDKIAKSGGTVMSANADYNDAQQIQQAKELIDRGIKVLVIIPVNTNTAAAIVRMANSNNVKTIAYERIISNCNLDYFISFDNVRIGELLAKEAMRIKPEGNYFVLNGDKTDRNAVWVREGFYKVLNPAVQSGKIKVVYDTYVEDWTSENAAYEFKYYVNLSISVPDVILSAYSGMNGGIFDFFEQEGVSPLPVVAGQAADTKETRAATNPKQRISLYKFNKLEAEAAADLAVKLIHGQVVPADLKYNNGYKEVNTIVIKDMKVESK